MSTQATPAPAELVRTFVNTRDIEDGTDALSTPRALTTWLREAGLLSSRAVADDGDLRTAVVLREALREALEAHHDDGAQPASPTLQRMAERLPLRLDFPEGGPRLVAAGSGVTAALAAVLAAVQESVADGSWRRLKICPADDCGWAFFDSSRNRSRTWCSMQVCGNRSKSRAFRARTHED